jgi:hypothetical protein
MKCIFINVSRENEFIRADGFSGDEEEFEEEVGECQKKDGGEVEFGVGHELIPSSFTHREITCTLIRCCAPPSPLATLREKVYI